MTVPGISVPTIVGVGHSELLCSVVQRMGLQRMGLQRVGLERMGHPSEALSRDARVEGEWHTDLDAQIARVRDASIVVVDLPAFLFPRVVRGLERVAHQPFALLQLRPGLAFDGRPSSRLAREVLGDVLEAYAVLAGSPTCRSLSSSEPSSAILACRDAKSLASIGDSLVDAALHLHCTQDLEGVEWAFALNTIVAFARGLARGAGLAEHTSAWVLGALQDELVALATREVGLGTGFGAHDGPWLRELRNSAYTRSSSEVFGEFLGRGFSLSDAAMSVGNASLEVASTTVLRALSARGVTRCCPGVEALADLAIGASSARELWSRLFVERCAR